MFIAHAPSGYLLAVSITERIRQVSVSASAAVIAGMVGAVAPDLDFLYFYLVDHRQTHHHKYVSHWPLSWLVLTAAAALWLRFAPRSKAGLLTLLFCLGGVLHVVLDSLVGDIWWLAPFVDRPYSLFKVRAHWSPWWMNFLLHWSFVAELVICFWALRVYRRRLDN